MQCVPTGNNQIISILIMPSEYRYFLVILYEERIQTFYLLIKLNLELFYRLIVFNIVSIVDGMVQYSTAMKVCNLPYPMYSNEGM